MSGERGSIYGQGGSADEFDPEPDPVGVAPEADDQSYLNDDTKSDETTLTDTDGDGELGDLDNPQFDPIPEGSTRQKSPSSASRNTTRSPRGSSIHSPRNTDSVRIRQESIWRNPGSKTSAHFRNISGALRPMRNPSTGSFNPTTIQRRGLVDPLFFASNMRGGNNQRSARFRSAATSFNENSQGNLRYAGAGPSFGSILGSQLSLNPGDLDNENDAHLNNRSRSGILADRFHSASHSENRATNANRTESRGARLGASMFNTSMKLVGWNRNKRQQSNPNTSAPPLPLRRPRIAPAAVRLEARPDLHVSLSQFYTNPGIKTTRPLSQNTANAPANRAQRQGSSSSQIQQRGFRPLVRNRDANQRRNKGNSRRTRDNSRRTRDNLQRNARNLSNAGSGSIGTMIDELDDMADDESVASDDDPDALDAMNNPSKRKINTRIVESFVAGSNTNPPSPSYPTAPVNIRNLQNPSARFRTSAMNVHGANIRSGMNLRQSMFLNRQSDVLASMRRSVVNSRSFVGSPDGNLGAGDILRQVRDKQRMNDENLAGLYRSRRFRADNQAFRSSHFANIRASARVSLKPLIATPDGGDDGGDDGTSDGKGYDRFNQYKKHGMFGFTSPLSLIDRMFDKLLDCFETIPFDLRIVVIVLSLAGIIGYVAFYFAEDYNRDVLSLK